VLDIAMHVPWINATEVVGPPRVFERVLGGGEAPKRIS